MMNDDRRVQDARARAEALFTIKAPASGDGRSLDGADSARPPEAEKIARLRALRLAKEAAERAAKTGRRRPGRK